MSSNIIMMAPGDTLMNEGDPSDSIYLLKTGQLNVFVNRNKVGVVNAGEFVGEMAFIDAQPRSATVVAAKPCELVEISKEAFNKSLNGIPVWLQQFIRTLMDRIRQSHDAL